MSLDASIWAWQQSVGKSSAKLVLLALADRAGADNCSYPSVETLCSDTELNRKTVIECIKHLKSLGLLVDTGERKGASGRVIVYRLIGVQNRVKGDEPRRKRINPKTGQSQKRDSTENGIVPKTDGNSPKNGTSDSPKIGTQNQSVEPINEHTAAAVPTNTPERCINEQQAAAIESPDHSAELIQPEPVDQPDHHRLFATDSPDHRYGLPMTLDWQPTSRFAELCQAQRISLTTLTGEQQEEILSEFRSYWYSRSHRPISQGQWEHKLAQQVKRTLVLVAERKARGEPDFDDTAWADNMEDVI